MNFLKKFFGFKDNALQNKFSTKHNSEVPQKESKAKNTPVKKDGEYLILIGSQRKQGPFAIETILYLIEEHFSEKIKIRKTSDARWCSLPNIKDSYPEIYEASKGKVDLGHQQEQKTNITKHNSTIENGADKYCKKRCSSIAVEVEFFSNMYGIDSDQARGTLEEKRSYLVKEMVNKFDLTESNSIAHVDKHLVVELRNYLGLFKQVSEKARKHK